MCARPVLLTLVAALSASGTHGAQAEDVFRPDGRYEAGIPAPAATLGFEIGTRPARHAEIVRYAEALAAASPRVVIERHARSHEGRDLVHLIISSADNIGRLEAIRGDITILADPRRELDDDALDELIARTPASVYLAYSIHGDELSGADAALRVAYELAAGENDDIPSFRDNLVVVVEPLENPDGRERILSMIAAYQGAVPNPDPDALSHSGFWPWGRGNHYFFDLNRDWFALVHPESRGRADILRRWRPQLVVDAHEMGSTSTYLFNPPRDPFNPNLPGHTREWWERFAADHARAFDRHGWSYFTREWNEEFYPGYGSALALYQGATGILYEQAATDGQPIRKPTGQIATYREAVARQFTSSMANLQTVVTNRAELLRSYRDARAEAVDRGREGPVRAFYFEPAPDAARAERLAARLAALGIEVEGLNDEGTLRAARSFWDDDEHDVTLAVGSFRVRLDQPDGLLARAILEPHTPMPDSSLAEEREHLERQKGSRVYDITAWSPLVASGLQAWWSSRLDDLDWATPETRSPAGGVIDGPGAYGWVFSGMSDASLILAAKLAAAEINVRVGEKPFVLDDRAYPRGSFLVRAEENDPGVADSLAVLASRAGVEVAPVGSARILEGPDLGGSHWSLLTEPRIAIAAGSPLDFTSVGAAWHLLDREVGLRASLVDVSRLGGIDLQRYNTLVLPHAWGGGGAYARTLGDPGIAALRSWIEDGGTVIALASGAEFLADSASSVSQVRPRRQALEDFPAPAFGLDEETIRSLERMQALGLRADGSPVTGAGQYEWRESAESLRIPGPGSPVLGPGTWEMLGERGAAARKREPLSVPGAGGPEPDDDTDAEASTQSPSSPEEERHARQKADARLQRFLPSGAILRADLDSEHWLTYGVGDRVAVLARRGDALLARDPVQTAGRYAAPATLHVGGLLWPEAVGRISQTAFLTRESKGRGQVVLFASDPNFRGYFSGTQRLFLNAVVLGPGLGARQTIPW